MADLNVPSPDAAGYWHFTYVTRDPDGRWYGGKRSTKKQPLLDRYLGSGNWIRKHPAREQLTREIVAFYPTSEAVYLAEADLVTDIMVLNDPLCMNECGGGEGMTVETFTNPEFRAVYDAAMARVWADPKHRAMIEDNRRRRMADPVWQAARIAAAQRRAADPKWQEAHAAALQRRSADPQWRDRQAAAARRRSAKPEWKEAVAAANRRKATDPKWLEAQAAAVLRRSSNPKWLASMAAAGKRRAAENAAKKGSLDTRLSLILG